MIKDIITISQGPIKANTYIVCNELNECLIIDLGADIKHTLKAIKQLKLNVVALLLTHGHFDHVIGVKSAVNERIGVFIGKNDAFMLESEQGCLAKLVGVKYQPVFEYATLEEGEYKLSSFTVKVIETPGHTIGSVCYIIDDCIFTGDTLFKNGYGRCDLPYGDYKSLKKSLDKIFALTDMKVYPGHGDETTLAAEKILSDNG